MKNSLWALEFKVKAPFGHFRNPYSTAYKQTYPFPPKPTVIGMIGAMLGWDERMVIAQSPNFKIAIPQWYNKGKIIEYTYILGVGKVRGSSRVPEEFRPERFEFLLHPEFWIFIMHQDQSLVNEIERRILEKDFTFPLFMGKNEFIITCIEMLKPTFKARLEEISAPTGVIFIDDNKVPTFFSTTNKIRPPELFIGVPKSLDISGQRRVQKEVCIVLVTREPIKLEKPLTGIRMNSNEYTVI